MLWPEKEMHNLRYIAGTGIERGMRTRDGALISPFVHYGNYGSNVFGGSGASRCVDGKYRIWLGRQHARRVVRHAEVMEIITHGELTPEDVLDAMVEVTDANLKELQPGDPMYLRPIVGPSDTQLGVGSEPGYVFLLGTRKRTSYYGDPQIGIRIWHPGPTVCRANTRCGVPGIKSAMNYGWARVWKNRAGRLHGAKDVLFETLDGCITELSGSNIFALIKGSWYTPADDQSILQGFTRWILILILEAMGYKVFRVRFSPTKLLYAKEVFACGSWAELTAINEIVQGLESPRILSAPFTGQGMGPVTRSLLEVLLALLTYDLDNVRWLVPRLEISEEWWVEVPR